MNKLTEARALAALIGRDLVQRRLWPIAVALLLALVAVPVLLRTEPEAEPPSAAAPAVAGETVAGPGGDPLVTAQVDGLVDRRVLGERKDPFTPTGERPTASDESDAGTGRSGPDSSSDSGRGGASDGSAPGGSSGGSASSSGGSAGSSDSPAGSTGSTGSTDMSPSAPAPTTPGGAGDSPGGGTTEPEKTFELHALKIRVNGEEPEEDLKRLDPLESKEKPAIIYLGLLEDEKTAVFLLDEGVLADGDGTCHPSPDNCQRVHLREGETEFFTGKIRPDAEPGAETTEEDVDFQLDIVDVRTRRTASASRAREVRAATSRAGRRALRSRVGRMGRLRYDRRTGTLRTLGLREYRAAMARASGERAGLGGGPWARASARRAGLGAP